MSTPRSPRFRAGEVHRVVRQMRNPNHFGKFYTIHLSDPAIDPGR